MSDVGKQIAAAEIAREAVIEALHRSGALEDDQFKSSDVDEVLAAVWFAMDEVWPGSRFGPAVERLEGTEPLTPEELASVVAWLEEACLTAFAGAWKAEDDVALEKLRARLAREDG